MTRFCAAFHRQQAPWGGVLLEILGGGVPPGSRNPDPISDKKRINLPHPFSDLGFWQKLLLSLLILERKQKNSSKTFRIRIFLFFSYSSGIERINAFIHSWQPLKNHTRFQTKMGKVFSRFQTKTAQKPYPMGRHIPTSTPGRFFLPPKPGKSALGTRLGTYLYSYIHSFFFFFCH